jgi:hypothetical protein
LWPEDKRLKISSECEAIFLPLAFRGSPNNAICFAGLADSSPRNVVPLVSHAIGPERGMGI